MRRSRFALALASVIALAWAGIAFADGASENSAFVDGKVKPAKLDKKKYKPVKLFAGVRTETTVDGMQSNPASETIDFGKNIKFKLKATPVCPGLPASGSTPEQAKAQCPKSFLGSGSAEIVSPGGSPISDIVVSLFHGGPGNGGGPATQNGLLLHTYSPTLGAAAPTVNGEIVKSKAGNKYGQALSVEHAPETGSLFISKFNTDVDKKNKSVLARCKAKKFLYHRTVVYTDGSRDEVTLKQPCKRKKKT